MWIRFQACSSPSSCSFCLQKARPRVLKLHESLALTTTIKSWRHERCQIRVGSSAASRRSQTARTIPVSETVFLLQIPLLTLPSQFLSLQIAFKDEDCLRISICLPLPVRKINWHIWREAGDSPFQMPPTPSSEAIQSSRPKLVPLN